MPTTVVYDGDCPFCRNYVALMSLRTAVGDVKLIDARSDAEIVQFLSERGFNINEGMAVIHGAKIHFGEDAVTFISSVTAVRPFMGKLIALVLRSKRRADVLYPMMKAGRRVTLKVLGIPLIRS
jgi:predicted DCC family thiol-disulfide oxidoreductase YuxK